MLGTPSKASDPRGSCTSTNTNIPDNIDGTTTSAGGRGELWWLVKLHLAGLPYLVTCTTLGLLAGSILPASIAKPTVAGLVLAIYIAEVATKGTGLVWVGLLTITHY